MANKGSNSKVGEAIAARMRQPSVESATALLEEKPSERGDAEVLSARVSGLLKVVLESYCIAANVRKDDLIESAVLAFIAADKAGDVQERKAS